MADLTPGSPEWARRVTASKVAAILGVSPFDSPRSVWHLMRGDVPIWGGNDATRRGHYLEDGVLAWWRDRYGIPHEPGVEYVLQPLYTLGDWAAATPDMLACHPDHDNVLVDAKTTTMDDEWGTPGTDQVPTHYYAQALWAMHLSGIHQFHFAVLHSRLRFEEYVVAYDAEQGAALQAKMREFYDSLDSDEPPALSDSLADFQTMRRLHPDIADKTQPDHSVDITEDDARALLGAVADLADAEAADRLHRSRVLAQMGRAQFALCNGIKVARRQANKNGISFVPLPKNLPLLTDMENAS